MTYGNSSPAVFLARPNRFIAEVSIGGITETVHVKNTGRCKELLTPGVQVYLEQSSNPNRKTKYDLIAVEKPLPGGGTLLINMDAQAPNGALLEWATAGHFRPDLTLLRPETTFGKSRFDFYWEAGEQKGFVEVKGVTLEESGHARFPDAPTERGVKHLEELILAKAAGYEAAICFVIQMKAVTDFAPNDVTHPAFGAALRRAQAAGVDILAYDCAVTPNIMVLDAPVPIIL
ncbi:MAG: DNA/RNA nuclease SfsA [Oscillospiraceae bacterium]